MSIFSGVASVKTNKIQDTLGYIKALLNDIPNTGEGIHYEEWLTLISLLKYEIEDEELAFEIFDEFSQKSDLYDPDYTYKKFWDSQVEGTGQITLGTLVHIAKREIPDYNYDNYASYFGTESITQIEKFTKRLEKLKNREALHFLPEEVENRKLPDVSVSPQIALTILLQPNKTYGTAKHAAVVSIIDPYAGDQLQQYITVNPMQDIRTEIDPDNPYKGVRCQAGVTLHRHAVLEFDTIDLDEQFSVFSSIELPYEALVYSGNKSIHAWIRIDAPDNETYKKRTRLINKMFNDFGYTKKSDKGFLDTAVLYDSSSIVRCPGAVRDNGQVQKVLWCEESKGWDYWYNNVYPKYLVYDEETEVSEDTEIFEDPERPRNFNRKKKRIDEILQEDYETQISQILKDTEVEDIENVLNNAVPQFAQNIFKKSLGKVTPSADDLYFLLIDSVLDGGCNYEGDLRKTFYHSCTLYDKFEKEREVQRKERLEKSIEHVTGQINEYVDPVLIEEIDKAIEVTKEADDPKEYDKMASSVVRMFEDLEYRPAIFQSGELYKYSTKAGKMLAEEFERNNHLCKGALYVYYDELHAYDPNSLSLKKVDVQTFPSYVTPYMAFVKKTKGQFNVVPLDNDTAAKILKSGLFLGQLRSLELISDVPIFKEVNGDAELVTGYDEEKKALITGDVTEYSFMEISEAIEIIQDLFCDFSFVDPSDLSRAIAALIVPAMCHADLLKGDFRPLCFIDADYAGAGKGTLVNTLTIPYTDNPALVTQDDSSIGSIDDKVGNAVMEGNNLIIVDNLKPTYRMKELSSSFLEGMLTSESIGFRSAGQRHKTLNVTNVCMYLTTNGMPLSKDLADRSSYVSIRKRDHQYSFRNYEQGHKNWLIENRPKIMSAIFTVLREYVIRGKPEKKPLEGHRFLKTVPIVNYIVTEIFGLPDVTAGNRQRTLQKADQNIDTVRAICFAVVSQKLLGENLSSIDLYEVLAEAGTEHLLNVSSGVEIYKDELGTEMYPDAKRAIGISVSQIFSRPNLLGRAGSKKETKSCKIEEFVVTRSFDSSSKSAQYTITKEGKDD